MKIKHVFFDLDRTLWDFEKNSEVALFELHDNFELAKHAISPEDFVKKYRAINNNYWKRYRKGYCTKEELRVGRFKDSFTALGINLLKEKHLNEAGDFYISRAPYQKELFPNTLEMLKTLKEWGIKKHIITNGFSEVQYIKLSNCGLIEYFDVIVCSDEFGQNKPHPSIFEHALKQAGAQAHESIMIGDDLHVDVLGAQAVGIEGVLFDPEEKFTQRNGILKISDLQELPDLVMNY
ncbi:putative hydrolase of the HAD superfamily [Lishizhenia tianjinensis]|uniref:Putative hydrolase of the HAD superfamily n=1 Tax=Lishizhenia tianjinensis TaxID=477690 RepID=A0A1I6YYY0_9FLAO|nr:YjjG family noncanonical pyrimidine nucleotidase [Lishizhenia tianjinensis]SFT55666.1 putative hydrolase of the HAD superfamily [Lishizhenia tianjinensis]